MPSLFLSDAFTLAYLVLISNYFHIQIVLNIAVTEVDNEEMLHGHKCLLYFVKNIKILSSKIFVMRNSFKFFMVEVLI